MTERELRLISARLPLSTSTIRRNAALNPGGVPPANAQPDGRLPLVRGKGRKKAGSRSTAGRVTIRLTVYAVRPADWDGWNIKQIQDGLRHASILVGDDWHLLQGEVRSEKVQTLAEERTVIELFEPSST